MIFISGIVVIPAEAGIQNKALDSGSSPEMTV